MSTKYQDLKDGDVVVFHSKSSNVYFKDITIGKHYKVEIFTTYLVIYDDANDRNTSVLEHEQDWTFVENTRHVHHDMIVEWAKNPSRVVETCIVNSDDELWYRDISPSWRPSFKYRFKDTVPTIPERVFPTTSLTEDELTVIFDKAYDMHYDTSYQAIANAAIKQYILDSENTNDSSK